MPAIAIIGGQWGDEGKGKIVELLAGKSDVVVRASGGANAGHTVINKYGQFALHLVPSGIFYPAVKCIIGNGVVVDPVVVIQEMKSLESSGISTSNLFISERAHLVMPYHILLDGLEEKARGASAIGTTQRGIGPAFVDKTARQGIRVGDLLEKEVLLARLKPVLAAKNDLITKVYGAKPLSLDETYKQLCVHGAVLSPHIADTQEMVETALSRGQIVLVEGAQGTLLDTDFGTYPYVTSSPPTAGGACQGTGIGPRRITRIIGIYKAYTTRVGGGPMPTELKDEIGELIREKAHEYGATTGRPRRCGWFDAVAASFSVQINSLSGLAITRLDVLDGLPNIKICKAYQIDGKIINRFPAQMNIFEKCQPLYEEMPGWTDPTSGARRYRDLPLAARRYLRKLEELLSCPIDIISVGARREETIIIKPIAP